MIPEPVQDWSSSFTVTSEYQKSLYHYLFCPVDHSLGKVPGGGIDVSQNVMYYGFRNVPRLKFRLVRNKDWTDPRAPIGGEDLESGGGAAPDSAQPFVAGPKKYVNFADDIAYNIENVYQTAGVAVLRPLVGVPEPVARWIEWALLLREPVRDVLELQERFSVFDPQRDLPAAPSTPQWQGWILSSGKDLYQMAGEIAQRVLQSAQLGEAFMRSYYDDYVAEMRQALNPGGKGGIDFVSPKLRAIARELRLPTPDNVADYIRQARVAETGTAQLSLPPELTDLIRQVLSGGLVPAPAPAVASAPVQVAPEPQKVPTPAEDWTATAPLPLQPETAEQHDAEVELDQVATPAEGTPAATIAEKTAEETPFGADDPPTTPRKGSSRRK
jgi:hypothetical protein